MNTINKMLGRLAHDEDGQDLIEYALLAAFIALVSISVVQLLGNRLKGIFGDINTQLTPPAGD